MGFATLVSLLADAQVIHASRLDYWPDSDTFGLAAHFFLA